MSKTTRRTPIALAIALAIGLAVPASASALNVYAAASLREVFEQIDGAPTYNFAGSNVLQTQIQNGAPADVFASASPQEAQALFKAGNCERPVTFATNKLIMIVPKDNPGGVRSVYSLRKGGLRVAIGTPGVPIGAYTRSVLKRLGLTKALSKNTVSQESNVAGIVSKVGLGSADVGFAYVTDGKIAADRVTAIKLPTLRAAARPLPDLRRQARRRRRERARRRSSTRSAPTRVAASSRRPASGCRRRAER